MDEINAKDAWDITKGNSTVLIGIIDDQFMWDHPDLVNKIDYINNLDYSGPSDHGTYVAGIAAAETDNGIGISSIGFNCHLLLYDGGYNNLLIASQNGAKVVNASWHTFPCSYRQDDQDLINEIHDNGTIVVASGGNQACGVTDYQYPACYDHVIAVAATLPNDGLWGKSTYNDKIDLSAPGYKIWATTKWGPDYYLEVTGTSFSAPVVTGLCGLMLSANSCLIPDQVEDILKGTAINIDDNPYNTPSAGKMGAGRIDAYQAVHTASLMYKATTDLYMRDLPKDFGIEPNNNSVLWTSQDIWVRNQQDGLTTHQNPIAGKPNYVYVRIRNKGCTASAASGNTLHVYWSKSGINSKWDPDPNEGSWVDDTGPCGKEYGKEIGSGITISTPIVAGGQQIVGPFSWTPNTPNYYDCNNAFCLSCGINYSLLARITSTEDPISNEPTGTVSTSDYVKNNNNLAWKNVIVASGMPSNLRILAGNNSGVDAISKFTFTVPTDEVSNSFFNYGSVKIYLGDSLLQRWENGGSVGSGISVCNDTLIQVLSPNAWIGNIPIDAGEVFQLDVMLNQYVLQLDKCQLNLDISQYDSVPSETAVIAGGVRFQLETCETLAFNPCVL